MNSECLKRSVAGAAIAAAMSIAGAAQGEVITYTATLSGAAEAEPNESPGTGFTQVDFDLEAHTMRVQVTFSGLLAPTTNCHIHSATEMPFMGTAMVATPVPTFPGFPGGVTSGSYDMTFDTSLASSWNPAFITAHGGTVASAEAFFAQSLANGTAYLNVHSTMFTGGEIRGFLVPSPGAAALLGIGGLTAMRRRRG